MGRDCSKCKCESCGKNPFVDQVKPLSFEEMCGLAPCDDPLTGIPPCTEEEPLILENCKKWKPK